MVPQMILWNANGNCNRDTAHIYGYVGNILIGPRIILLIPRQTKQAAAARMEDWRNIFKNHIFLTPAARLVSALRMTCDDRPLLLLEYTLMYTFSPGKRILKAV